MQNNPTQTTTGSFTEPEFDGKQFSTFIHIESEHRIYGISPSELDILEEGSRSIWKDVTLGSLGLSIPCLINAAVEANKLTVNNFTAEIFLNSVIGVCGAVMAIVGAVCWKRQSSRCDILLQTVRKREGFKIK